MLILLNAPKSSKLDAAARRNGAKNAKFSRNEADKFTNLLVAVFSLFKALAKLFANGSTDASVKIRAVAQICALYSRFGGAPLGEVFMIYFFTVRVKRRKFIAPRRALFSMIYCINFRYFTAPASKFSKPECEILFISNASVTPFIS